jgi:hypothetical protein
MNFTSNLYKENIKINSVTYRLFILVNRRLDDKGSHMHASFFTMAEQKREELN